MPWLINCKIWGVCILGKMLNSVLQGCLCQFIMYLRFSSGLCLRSDNYFWAWKQSIPFIHWAFLDGAWSNWINTTGCVGSCGFGAQTWVRSCDNPSPCNKGLSCSPYNSSFVSYSGGIQYETNTTQCLLKACIPPGPGTDCRVSGNCICKCEFSLLNCFGAIFYWGQLMTICVCIGHYFSVVLF